METVSNLNTPKAEMQKTLHIQASELLSNIPIDESDAEADLEKWENLFGNLEQLESRPLDDAQKKKARFEMALQNEYIEREFEQTFISALIHLRGGIAKAGWPQAFRGAMNISRPKLLPIVKATYPEVADMDIENVFAMMAFKTMDRIDEGRITTPELEEIRQEVLKAQPSKKEIEPPQHPQPAAFINAFETNKPHTASSLADTPQINVKATSQQQEVSRVPDLQETPIEQTPPRGGDKRSN
jgi:hypothetical protein